MKHSDPDHAHAPSRRSTQTHRGPRATPTLNEILKLAYRRHTRGRVALAAVTACLGR